VAALQGLEGIATNPITVTQSVYNPAPDGQGPRVSNVVIPASGRLIVVLTAEASGSNSGQSACSTAFMSVSLNGSAALDANSLRVTGNVPVRASITVLITGLTPGNIVTFEAVYKNIGCAVGSTFNARQIIVIPN
jgi:L-asparagine transporter-like permease